MQFFLMKRKVRGDKASQSEYAMRHVQTLLWQQTPQRSIVVLLNEMKGSAKHVAVRIKRRRGSHLLATSLLSRLACVAESNRNDVKDFFLRTAA
jgi:hypothetical protein